MKSEFVRRVRLLAGAALVLIAAVLSIPVTPASAIELDRFADDGTTRRARPHTNEVRNKFLLDLRQPNSALIGDELLYMLADLLKVNVAFGEPAEGNRIRFNPDNRIDGDEGLEPCFVLVANGRASRLVEDRRENPELITDITGEQTGLKAVPTADSANSYIHALAGCRQHGFQPAERDRATLQVIRVARKLLAQALERDSHEQGVVLDRIIDHALLALVEANPGARPNLPRLNALLERDRNYVNPQDTTRFPREAAERAALPSFRGMPSAGVDEILAQLNAAVEPIGEQFQEYVGDLDAVMHNLGQLDENQADGGPGGVDAGEANADAGEANADAGEANADAGEANADAGEANADAGEANADAGEANADAGEANADAGEANADAGDANADAGEANRDAGDVHAEDAPVQQRADAPSAQAEPSTPPANAPTASAPSMSGSSFVPQKPVPQAAPRRLVEQVHPTGTLSGRHGQVRVPLKLACKARALLVVKPHGMTKGRTRPIALRKGLNALTVRLPKKGKYVVVLRVTAGKRTQTMKWRAVSK